MYERASFPLQNVAATAAALNATKSACERTSIQLPTIVCFNIIPLFSVFSQCMNAAASDKLNIYVNTCG